ncbi:hypothetical protein EYF80_039852 [Liparis tanakae]|uniref:Uncharacterized protein n=1 Tax=Liparis tanakae TaxID=230148 RepID=A0A4Z2GB74_9TELE|nr:hypothetical protein EYF80_039852 [Liparis tanakae]
MNNNNNNNSSSNNNPILHCHLSEAFRIPRQNNSHSLLKISWPAAPSGGQHLLHPPGEEVERWPMVRRWYGLLN